MSHPIPHGRHTITPHLIVKGASEAIEFYKKAFGAEELSRMPFPGPDGQVKLGHADLKIGDSRLFLADEFPEQGGLGPQGHSPVTLHLYVTDADAAFTRAVEAGATVRMPLADNPENGSELNAVKLSVNPDPKGTYAQAARPFD